MNEERTADYTARLARMIACQTVSSRKESGESFCRFRALLREEFPHLFGVAEYEDFDGSFLLVLRGGGEREPILLMNHHDVVEAEGCWSHPPFAGEVADGRIYGRGTLDTKGGLFAMLQAADELVHEGYTPPRDIYFMSTCNEEIGGAGAELISRTLASRGVRFALVLDEGGMILCEPIGGAKATYAMIGVGEKGYADIKFTARSRGGHASTPGKNTPLVRLGKFMAAVEKKPPFGKKISPTVCEMFVRLSKSMRGPVRFLLAHPRLFAPLLKAVMPAVSDTAGAMLRTTVAFTMASGSASANVLPQEASVVCNMRYSHHQGGEESIAALTRLAEKFDLEVTVLNPGFPSPLSSHGSAGFRLVEEAVGVAYPQAKTSPYVMTAASDCRFMSRVSDCCLRFAPFHISGEQMASVHAIDENLDVATLAPAVDFYRHILKNTTL